jgi:nitrogen fixation/metabolism regulation signal transduction histidine kinase
MNDEDSLMSSSAPSPAVSNEKYKRSVKNYLIDARFQLKYTGYMVGITLVISAMLGGVLLSTTGKVFEESRTVGRQGEEVVKKTKAVSAVVQMNIKDQYADNPDLAASFAQASKESDDEIEAQQQAIRSQQDTLIRQQERTLYEIFVALGVTVVLIGIMGIYVTHKVAGPVYKMKLLLRQVQDGKLKVPPGRLRKGDELQEFFDAFAAMVRELRARQQQEVDDLDAAITAARGSGANAESVAKIVAVRDEMMRALDV